MFGPETSTAGLAMVGGMVGNNSSWLHSIVWGDTRDHLLEATMLLDDESEVLFGGLDEAALFSKLTLPSREGDIYRRMNDLLLDTDNREAIQTGYPKPTLTRRNTAYALDMMLDTGQPFNFCHDRNSVVQGKSVHSSVETGMS